MTDGEHEEAHDGERGRRGRSADRMVSHETGLSLRAAGSSEEEIESIKEKRGVLGRMMSGDVKDKGKKRKEDKVEGWKEFPKGKLTTVI